jgi:hypothetical protein
VANFSGFLLASSEARNFSAEDFVVTKPIIKRGPRLIHGSSRSFGLKAWEEYTLYSPVPLSEERSDPRPEYSYPVYIVRGYSKILLLCQRRKAAEYVVSTIMTRKFFPPLRKVSIFIDRLIDHCATPDSEFLATSVHGRFSGSSRNVQSMSLYGDDVTRSPIFAENHEFFNFHSCGVGRRRFPELTRESTDDKEIVRLASDGFLSLNLTTRSHAREVQSVVEYVLQNGWVEDWIPIKGGKL